MEAHNWEDITQRALCSLWGICVLYATVILAYIILLHNMILNGFYHFGKTKKKIIHKTWHDFISLPIWNQGWVIIQFALGKHIYLNKYT